MKKGTSDRLSIGTTAKCETCGREEQLEVNIQWPEPINDAMMADIEKAIESEINKAVNHRELPERPLRTFVEFTAKVLEESGWHQTPDNNWHCNLHDHWPEVIA